MDENQFDMYGADGGHHLACGFEDARRVCTKRALFKIAHQSGYLICRRKSKIVPGEIDLPVLPCPGIYWTEPDMMHFADIMGTELMIPVIEGYNFLVSSQQLASLDLVPSAGLEIYSEPEGGRPLSIEPIVSGDETRTLRSKRGGLTATAMGGGAILFSGGLEQTGDASTRAPLSTAEPTERFQDVKIKPTL